MDTREHDTSIGYCCGYIGTRYSCGYVQTEYFCGYVETGYLRELGSNKPLLLCVLC